jgi:hypothetical protein
MIASPSILFSRIIPCPPAIDKHLRLSITSD